MATETALELDVEAAGYTGGEGVHFGSFPGVWFPGRPISAAALGFGDADEAVARAEELGLPLTVVHVDAGTAPPPARPNHVLAEAQDIVLEHELDEQPAPRTHAELDTAAAAAGVSFPDDVKTVQGKTAFLEQARTGSPEGEA